MFFLSQVLSIEHTDSKNKEGLVVVNPDCDHYLVRYCTLLPKRVMRRRLCSDLDKLEGIMVAYDYPGASSSGNGHHHIQSYDLASLSW